MNNPATEQENNLRVILDALTKGRTLAEVRAALSRVARTSSDKQLKIYLAPVRGVFASAALQTMDGSATMTMPTDRPPYNALIAYCRRRLGI